MPFRTSSSTEAPAALSIQKRSQETETNHSGSLLTPLSNRFPVLAWHKCASARSFNSEISLLSSHKWGLPKTLRKPLLSNPFLMFSSNDSSAIYSQRVSFPFAQLHSSLQQWCLDSPNNSDMLVLTPPISLAVKKSCEVPFVLQSSEDAHSPLLLDVRHKTLPPAHISSELHSQFLLSSIEGTHSLLHTANSELNSAAYKFVPIPLQSPSFLLFSPPSHAFPVCLSAHHLFCIHVWFSLSSVSATTASLNAQPPHANRTQ